MNFIPVHDSRWQLQAGGDGPPTHAAPRAHALLSLEQWHAVRDHWPAELPIGVLMPNSIDVSTVVADLPRLALLVLQFPKWTDGRAYSQARLLRGRHRFEGDLRASGDVLVDMLPLLQRTGFSSVQLRADQKLDSARRALRFFNGHYQRELVDPPPRVNHQAAGTALTTTTASAVDQHALKTPGYEQRVAHALALLREAAQAHHGRIVQATSLGVEGMVITDLIARHHLPVVVATLDTGALHAQTTTLISRIETHYGIQVERYGPRPQSVIQFVRNHGALAMREHVDLRKACCALRKLEPMERLLAGHEAWITGLRREQSEHRADVPFHEIDNQDRDKYYPLADWSLHDVWHYIQAHDVPYNELHDHGFPSIGCQPCTRAVAPGEDFRAGRWWWEQGHARECGLHSRPQPVTA